MVNGNILAPTASGTIPGFSRSPSLAEPPRGWTDSNGSRSGSADIVDGMEGTKNMWPRRRETLYKSDVASWADKHVA